MFTPGTALHKGYISNADIYLTELECIVLVDVPKEVRSQRVRERSFKKFGERILQGGDLFDKESKWFSVVDGRPEDYTTRWLETVKCSVIKVDGTLPIENNVEYLIEATGNYRR